MRSSKLVSLGSLVIRMLFYGTWKKRKYRIKGIEGKRNGSMYLKNRYGNGIIARVRKASRLSN